MLTPVYMLLAYPDEFATGQTILSAPGWMVGGGLAGLVVGCLLGSTAGFAISLADTLWRGRQRVRWRVALGGVAGLAHSAYLLAFTLMELFDPVAGPRVFAPVYAAYGVAVGMIISIAVPGLGVRRPVRRQLLNAAYAGVASAVVTIPYVLLVYLDEAAASLLSRLLYAFLLPFGIGLALSSRKGRRS
jgi:hypothetical protein